MGGPNFSTITNFSTIIGALVAFGLVGAPHANAAAFETDQLLLRDITGTVDIKTTTGGVIDIEISQGGAFHEIKVEEVDGVLVVSGERWVDELGPSCCDNRIRRTEDLRRDREATKGATPKKSFFDDYPTIVISMPIEGDVSFEDARIQLAMERLAGRLSLEGCYVYGETSDVETAIVGLIDGSQLAMGNIGAGLEVDISGDAGFLAGDVAMADVDIAGPGDVILGEIDGMLDVSIAGSGVLRATRLDGPMTARIAGSGGAAVKSGVADALRATVDGSGGVYFGGEVKDPQLRLHGSSEVRMRSVDGRVQKTGQGTVYVGDEVFSDDD
ncbi:MAG: hypothetical protein AAFW81_05530 [Pseudomonadota bacterium]